MPHPNKKRLQNRATEVFITHLRPTVRAAFAKAGVLDLLPPQALQADVAGAMAKVGSGSVANSGRS